MPELIPEPNSTDVESKKKTQLKCDKEYINTKPNM
jgi:hypothetical protein